MCTRHNVFPGYISWDVVSTVSDFFAVWSLLGLAHLLACVVPLTKTLAYSRLFTHNSWPDNAWCVAQRGANLILHAASRWRKRAGADRASSKRKQSASSRQESQGSKATQKQQKLSTDKENEVAPRSSPNSHDPKRGMKSPRRQKPTDARLLACPFCKSDPDRHRQCSNFAGSKLSYVKQHIYRTHEKPYCTVCMSLFDSPDERDAHLRQQSCQRSDFVLQTGYIDTRQHAELHRRAPAALDTLESQWYHVFDIVCPGQPRPASPYNDFVITPGPIQHSPPQTDVSLPSEVSEARDFLTSDAGIEIVLRHVQGDQTLRRNEYGLRESITRGLGEAFSTWATRYSPENRSSSQDSGDDRHVVPSNDRAVDDRPLHSVYPRSSDESPPGTSNWDMTMTQNLEHVPEAFGQQPVAPAADGQRAGKDIAFNNLAEQQLPHSLPANILPQDWTLQSATSMYVSGDDELFPDIWSDSAGLASDSLLDSDFDEQWQLIFGQF